ncbi:MAG: MBL fold metallo-hydrolase [Candidatus Moduliflexus flocculans]|nr:MBL fold metallo-hydrolase [Candidatus Moduliflexus flocculans]
MRIHFHGAAQTVTGSQHLLEINGHRLLLDCGLFQGRRDETYSRNLNFVHDPRKVDAVILSHAHIDHCGNLPNLVKNGYEGPIYATRATVDLATIMMADSGRIQEGDAEFVNKKRARRGETPIKPLYTEADAGRAADLFRGVDYNQAFEVVPGVVARLIECGSYPWFGGDFAGDRREAAKRRISGSPGILGGTTYPYCATRSCLTAMWTIS